MSFQSKVFQVICLSMSLLFLLLSSCENNHDRVIAVTGTVIGLSIAENPQTQLYEGKLGYARSEVALVPTNRSAGIEANKSLRHGARDCPDILMEINQSGIFSKSEGGIYQRLAVGTIAVTQPGAAAMFAKNPQGDISPGAGSVIAKSLDDSQKNQLQLQVDKLLKSKIKKDTTLNGQTYTTMSDYANAYVSANIKDMTLTDVIANGGSNLRKLISELDKVADKQE